MVDFLIIFSKNIPVNFLKIENPKRKSVHTCEMECFLMIQLLLPKCKEEEELQTLVY